MAFGLKLKDNNFIEAYKRGKKSETVRKTPLWISVSLLLLALVMALLYSYIGLQKYSLNSDMDTHNAYIYDESNIALYNEAIENENHIINYLYKKKENMFAIQSFLKNIPALQKTDFNTFLTCGSSQIIIDNLTYDNTLSSISFSAVANNAKDISSYIKRLKDTGLFINVEYSGYIFTEGTGYSFEITCTIRAVQ